MASILLPHYSRAPLIFGWKRILSAFAVFSLCGVALGSLADPVIGWLFADETVPGQVIQLLFAAYAADILLTAMAANLQAHGDERGLARTAIFQTGTVLVGSIAFLSAGPVAVAAAVFVGRCVAVLSMTRQERHLPLRSTAKTRTDGPFGS